MFATGGRGGTLYRVTNLNANGPESLADAVSQPNRVVVFAVSVTIDLSKDRPGKGGKIQIRHPNITMAGQTAPGEGICIDAAACRAATVNALSTLAPRERYSTLYMTEYDKLSRMATKFVPQSVDEYMEARTADRRPALDEVRKLCRKIRYPDVAN